MNPLSNIPEMNARNFGLGELNRRITDLKMEPGTTPPPQPSPISKNCQTDINLRIPPSSTMTTAYLNPAQIRRDSNQSTTSSSYYSMRSADMSRRSSQASQQSSISTMRPNYYNSSFYDPISPGSSRRSSSMSTATNGGQSLPPPPSSHLISTHLQRLQNSRYSIPNTSTNGNFLNPGQSTGMLGGPSDRRMSEPVPGSSNLNPSGANFMQQPPRPRSATPKGTSTKVPTPTRELHPNQEVVLDEVEEGEMVENKLVIPDEMLQYLNQVAGGDQETATPKVPTGLATPNNQPTETWKSPNEGTPNYSCMENAGYPLNNLSNILMSPQSQYSNDGNVMSPQTPQQQVMSPMMPETPTPVTPVHQANYEQPSVQCPLMRRDNMMTSNFNGNNSNNMRFNGYNNESYHQQQGQNQPQMGTARPIACNNMIGYFHRTDQSAHHCCLALMMQGN